MRRGKAILILSIVTLGLVGCSQGKTADVSSISIEKDGSVTGIQEMRSPSEDLTKEAKRVVSAMPKWKPGKQRGKPVRVKYVLPVTFRLQ